HSLTLILILQQFKYPARDRFRRSRACIDGKIGTALVERRPHSEQLLDFLQAAAEERWTALVGFLVCLKPLPERSGIRREPNNTTGGAQALQVRFPQHNTPSCGDDMIVRAAKLFQNRHLFFSDTCLPVLLKDSPNA